MDAINLDILKQLQEYAQMYFDAIVEANSECGKCKFANGKYTAKDVTKWIYALPCDDIFNEDIILESGTFKCKFPYRRIFEVLSDWETMCRAGKLKTLFEIGEDEVKSAKVLTQEKTVLGAFKTKSMKLQHIGGNWWGLPKEIRKGNAITGYYELNGVMFAPGKTFWGDVASAGNQEFCKNRDDADIIKLIKSYIGQHCSENPYCEYITEVARLAGISNKPDQAATPTDTPQIPTESTETVNVSSGGENTAERAGNAPERKIKYFHYTPEQLKRYIIDVYEKYANGEWVLQPHKQKDTDAGLWDVVGGKIGYWTNWRREKFSEVNMDFNSPTCHVCYKINRTYQKDDFIVSNEKLLEFTIGGNYYYIQKQTYSKGKHRWCYTIMDAHGDFAVNDFSYTKREILQRFNKWWKKNATIIWRSSEFAPQSPETPQAVECTTDAPESREMARKRQNRAAGCAQRARRSGLGTNGYSMLDYASAMLAAMNVPRKCSTELSPPGYVPPIRGDCTTYKRPTNDHITDLKPP